MLTLQSVSSSRHQVSILLSLSLCVCVSLDEAKLIRVLGLDRGLVVELEGPRDFDWRGRHKSHVTERRQLGTQLGRYPHDYHTSMFACRLPSADLSLSLLGKVLPLIYSQHCQQVLFRSRFLSRRAI